MPVDPVTTTFSAKAAFLWFLKKLSPSRKKKQRKNFFTYIFGLKKHTFSFLIAFVLSNIKKKKYFFFSCYISANFYQLFFHILLFFTLLVKQLLASNIWEVYSLFQTSMSLLPSCQHNGRIKLKKPKINHFCSVSIWRRKIKWKNCWDKGIKFRKRKIGLKDTKSVVVKLLKDKSNQKVTREREKKNSSKIL